MSEIMRDPLWNFVATLVGSVSLLVTIFLSVKQRQRKALSYEILSDESLLSVKNEIKGKLQILYEGKAVQQMRLIVLRIFNSGNVPIQISDYEQSTQLCFGKNAQILSAEVVGVDPKELNVSINIEENKVIVNPILLNKTDFFKIKILTTKSCDQPLITGRIVGVKKISKFVGPKMLCYFLICVGIVLQITGYLAGPYLGSSIAIVLVMAGVLVDIFGLAKMPQK
jgi:hypothetical protein